jgi:hypothetical protein
VQLLLSLLMALAILQVTQTSIFEVDLWPEEGVPVFEAVSGRLRLREFPSLSSKVVTTLMVPPGQRLAFDDTRYRTTKAGRFTALTAGPIAGRSLGQVTRLSKVDYYSGKFSATSVPLKAGEHIEYVQYRAEGTCFVRIASQVIDAAPCPNQQPAQFRLEVEPTTEWWIHITWNEKASGWVLVSGATVKVVDRRG